VTQIQLEDGSGNPDRFNTKILVQTGNTKPWRVDVAGLKLPPSITILDLACASRVVTVNPIS
jgi:hypothetical protein